MKYADVPSGMKGLGSYFCHHRVDGIRFHVLLRCSAIKGEELMDIIILGVAMFTLIVVLAALILFAKSKSLVNTGDID